MKLYPHYTYIIIILKVFTLFLQLNKVIEENSSLRNRPPPEPTTSPQAMEQILEEREGEGEGEEDIPLYSQVDKSRVYTMYIILIKTTTG